MITGSNPVLTTNNSKSNNLKLKEMNNLINSILYLYCEPYLKMQEEFAKKKEEARKKYWDACKLPRKKKKKQRKEAISEYNLYS